MSDEDAVRPIEQYREYLLVLARLHRDLLAEVRMDPSDVVQMTLLKAHQGREQFRGRSGREQAAWIRMILTNTMIDAVRRTRPSERFSGRSLEDALERSSLRLEAMLRDRHGIPGSSEDHHESLAALAHALTALPDDQRTAVELRYLQELSVGEIGRRMDRSPASVGGLLQRGLRRLREVLQEN